MLCKKINKGSTIGVISPASAENPDLIKANIAILKNLGFNVKEGRHIYERNGYLCGKDEARVEDIMNMFIDKSVDMILCVRGGYGTMRLLPYIDFNIIKENPKLFMGYSDITALLNSFYQRCDLVTYHGPMLLNNLSDKETHESFIFNLTKEHKPYKLNDFQTKPFSKLVGGTAEGNIVGGNLSLIAGTMGTPYEIDMKDKILFLEEIDEEPYRIDRMLTQLLLAGKLQSCSGFMLGQFKGCEAADPKSSLSLDHVLRDRIINLNKPTLSGIMSGHDYPKLTIPIGVKAKLDCNLGTISIL